jgi:bacillithiol system protein YtxJ
MAEWREIETVEEWNQTLEATEGRRALIFKHSTRCPISARAWKEYQAFVENTTHNDIDYIMVKVIQSRAVSNHIEQDLQIKHESPQAILVQNKIAIWNESHSKIRQNALVSAIES